MDVAIQMLIGAVWQTGSAVCRKEVSMTNAQAWDYAIGMIKVDGLEPTEDFKKYIEKEKKGEITMDDAKRFLDKKYKIKESEADA